MQRPSIIHTWNRNAADEEAMGAAHAPIWRRMIDVGVNEDLRPSTVLDYGCNQGGFLRMLYDRHPFRSAVGIDIARFESQRGRQGLQAAQSGRTCDARHVRPARALDQGTQDAHPVHAQVEQIRAATFSMQIQRLFEQRDSDHNHARFGY